MALKPEKIAGNCRHLATKACARARKHAKSASSRLARRAAKADPENAPTGRIVRGYLD